MFTQTLPTLPAEMPINKDTGDFTTGWKMYFAQQNQMLQQLIGTEGFRVSNQDQTNSDVIQAAPPINPGTLLFNTDIVNGGSMGSPNGQLSIQLADGNFHLIPNL